MNNDTDLITSGSLAVAEPAQRQTLVANQMIQFLEQEHKQLDESVLDWMMAAFKRHVVKQIMTPRDTRKGHDSCSMYTSSCPRKAWHQYNGTEGEKPKARAYMKWLTGDTIELDVVGVACLAGVRLVDNNRDLFITGKDGVQVSVHPDGRIIHDGVDYNVECKSADTFGFDRWLANGGPDDTWGYLTQASVEIQAWREAGYDVNSTCFVAVSTGSRQGSIAEWIIPYDQSLVDAWHERRMLARGKDLPPVPFQAEAETEYVKGKLLGAKYLEQGDAEPCLDKNGRTHGWKVKTGRKILPMACSYCSYKQQCWPGAELDVVSGKPVWCVK